MKQWIIDNRLYFIGALAGGLAGFLYWNYIGCVSGTCAITSNPLRSTLYFALMGSLLLGFFKKTEKKTDHEV